MAGVYCDVGYCQWSSKLKNNRLVCSKRMLVLKNGKCSYKRTKEVF